MEGLSIALTVLTTTPAVLAAAFLVWRVSRNAPRWSAAALLAPAFGVVACVEFADSLAGLLETGGGSEAQGCRNAQLHRATHHIHEWWFRGEQPGNQGCDALLQ